MPPALFLFFPLAVEFSTYSAKGRNVVAVVVAVVVVVVVVDDVIVDANDDDLQRGKKAKVTTELKYLARAKVSSSINTFR